MSAMRGRRRACQNRDALRGGGVSRAARLICQWDLRVPSRPATATLGQGQSAGGLDTSPRHSLTSIVEGSGHPASLSSLTGEQRDALYGVALQYMALTESLPGRQGAAREFAEDRRLLEALSGQGGAISADALRRTLLRVRRKIVNQLVLQDEIEVLMKARADQDRHAPQVAIGACNQLLGLLGDGSQ
jgi:hypothetical protein